MDWKKYFKKDKEIVLVTATAKGVPNASIVISVGLFDKRVVIANCHLCTTIKNIKENDNVCLVGGYFRIKGKAKTYSSGKYFNLCVKENKGYPVSVSSALVISIGEVFNLDKVKPVKI